MITSDISKMEKSTKQESILTKLYCYQGNVFQITNDQETASDHTRAKISHLFLHLKHHIMSYFWKMTEMNFMMKDFLFSFKMNKSII